MGLKAEMARLAGASEAANARNDMLAAQLDQMRATIDKLAEEKIRVTDLLKQTEIEKTRVDQMARDLQERINAVEEENDELRKSGAVAKTEKGQEAPSAIGEAITGTVESEKDNLASINIGSAKGIKPNMKLTVYRGDKFVAFLRIEDVEVGKAAGIIVDRRLDPVQGDKVTTSLQNY
jgi:cell shape-determining protein MreC